MRGSHPDSIEHISPNSEVRALAFVAVGLLAAAAVVSTASAQTPTAIGRSTRLEESLKPGDSREYGLRLKRGESAEVIVRQEGVDVVVDLVSPAGKLLDSVDGPTGRNGDEVVEIIARDSGVYLLKVSPLDKSEPPGDFRLEVRALRGTRETEDLLRKRRSARTAAVEWLRPRSARSGGSGPIPTDVNLSLLDDLAGRMRVLGLGEATHGSREFGDLRVSLTRYLIERHGFRIVALEASASNLDQAASYLNGESEWTPTVARLIESKIWIGRRARREIVEWVHGWNRGHPKDRVQVIGVDASGNLEARETLHAFLGRAYGEDTLERWAPVERELAAADDQTAVFGDSGVAAAARQSTLEVVAMLDLDASILKSRFGAPAYDSALEASRILAEFTDFNSGPGLLVHHSRDWYMATRVLRAIQERGEPAKAVYWAHNAHVAHPSGSNRTAGALLRGSLGCEYAALAVAFDEGSFVAQIPNDLENRLAVSTLPPAADESIESVLRELYSDGALATWACSAQADTGASSVPEWLRTTHPMHWIGGLYTPGTVESAAFRNFDLIKDFDGIVFLPRVTAEDIPADRPFIPARKRG